MTTTNVQFNPMLVTTAPGLFNTTSEGYVQGCSKDSPNTRNNLAGGIVSPAAAGPMWGGLLVTDSLTTAGIESSNIGSVLTLATSLANVTAVTVFDQSLAMISVPGAGVPMSYQSMALNFYRMGNGARIPMQCSAATAATLLGGPSNQQVSWDFTNQVIIPYTNTGPNAGALNCKVLDVNISNSKVIGPVTVAGNTSIQWINNGSVVLLQF